MQQHTSSGTVATSAVGGHHRHSWLHQTEQPDAKRASVEAEVQRMKSLPPVSNYAVHRLRVLDKVMKLLSLPPDTRSSTEAEELELLFSSLSL